MVFFGHFRVLIYILLADEKLIYYFRLRCCLPGARMVFGKRFYCEQYVFIESLTAPKFPAHL